MIYGFFVACAFLSSFLLFLLEPMMAKLLLPSLGGAPAVWNTALVFYQMALLGGYAYAHLGQRFLGSRAQRVLHLLLIAASLFCLPVALHSLSLIDPAVRPIAFLLLNLFVSIGLPFFLLSSHAPMLQHLFAQADHPAARNPYLLYGASNIGSMLGLFAYPFAVEPLLTLPQQSWAWTGGYIGLFVLLGGTFWKLGNPEKTLREAALPDESPSDTTLRQCLRWMVLAFVPSSLLLGVTTHITSDITSVPLLWIIPLAIYLLTFILAFAERPIGYENALKAQLTFLAMAVLVKLLGVFELTTPALLIHLLLFYTTAMVCHGQLALEKPPARQLTVFFLCISFGGALGGIFNALLTPLLFPAAYEYPLIVLLAILLRPGSGKATHWRERLGDLACATAFFAGAVLVFTILSRGHGGMPGDKDPIHLFHGLMASRTKISVFCYMAGFVGLFVLSRKKPWRLGMLVIAMLWFQNVYLASSSLHELFQGRNFFGISRVLDDAPAGLRYYMHGIVVHGEQPLDPAKKRMLTSYYWPLDGIARKLSRKPERIAIAGLGIGVSACVFDAGTKIDFYEIDALVIHLAEDPDYFTYMRDCPATKQVVLGDARLNLAKAPDHSYDLIILDAYNSDSLPVHLLTREAVQLYEQKLSPGGVLAFHISNGHLNLEPILGNISQSLGDAAISRMFHTKEAADNPQRTAKWLLMAKDKASFAPFAGDPEWHAVLPSNHRVWSDHYTNILEAILAQYNIGTGHR